MSDTPIHEQLKQADDFVQNALATPDILDAFAEIRHGRPYLEEGQSLAERARRLHQHQQKEYGEQYAATDGLYEARRKAHALYDRHMKLARVAFRSNREALQALNLEGRRHRALTPWIGQVFDFYDSLLEHTSWQVQMSAFGVTTEDLEAGRAAIQAAYEASRHRNREREEAQEATTARDEALEALDDWMDTSRQLARVVLTDRPQMLESLGINGHG